MVIQILITLIAIVVALKAITQFRRHLLAPAPMIGWIIFWIAITILVWLPDLTDRIAALLQVGRGADAIMYLSLIAIFYLFFRVFVRLEKTEQLVTLLARAIALIDTDSKR